MEEERRLMYVAATRARNYLAVIFPSIGYSRQFGMTIITFPVHRRPPLPSLEPWRAEVEEW